MRSGALVHAFSNAEGDAVAGAFVCAGALPVRPTHNVDGSGPT